MFSLADKPFYPPVSQECVNRTRVRIEYLRFFGRRRRFSVVFAGLTLALLAVLACLLLERGRQESWANTKIRTYTASVATPLPEFREIVDSFRPNQTITEALLQQGLSNRLINQIVDGARPVYDLARVKASRIYWLCFTKDGQFRDFRYRVDDERYLTVYHDLAQDRFVPVMKSLPYETRVEQVSGTIESSLFSSVAAIGEDDQLASDLADIFSSDIDFNTDIQKGDFFQVLTEKKYLNGQFAGHGEILAAVFSNQRKLLTGFRFEDDNGKPAYYAPDGRALKKSFLKSPLRVMRITSRFSPHRMHPILRVVRPHLGVDYAAPIGTPVRAVGAGVVIGAGRSGGNGKMVKIRHLGGYETMYLHLSRIAVKSGARVAQGDIIGNLGSSGLSTGPHLDFRISRHGVALNPTKVISPPGKPVAPAQFSRFAALRDKLNDELRISNDELKQASAKEGPPR